jgi:hypothetical protein
MKNKMNMKTGHITGGHAPLSPQSLRNIAFACLLVLFSACGDMLETNSDRFLTTDEHQLDSANDSLYSVIGIISQLQKLGDRYVILGELRGELMDITENTGMDLQAVHNFTVNADNPYASVKEYYEVINNCNYFIQHVDTSVLSGGVKVMLKEYAAVKAFRAWTYMQLALNFGKVTYIEEPLLSIKDMNKDYPQYEFDELARRLIADLEPFQWTERPAYGTIGNYDVQYYFIPIPVLLGDLYLWTGQYERAVQTYCEYISRENKMLQVGYNSSWLSPLFLENTQNHSWPSLFYSLSDEVLTIIPFSSEYGNSSAVLNMTIPVSMALNRNFTYELVPSQVAKDMWDSEVYTYYNDNPAAPLVAYNYGDLRGKGGSYMYYLSDGDSIPYIRKYESSVVQDNQTIYSSVFLYRISTMYLHLAEALNHWGKPTLAFAVLKYGLERETLIDPARVSLEEAEALLAYCDFTADRFSRSAAVREHGLGYPARDSIYYVWDEHLETKTDSIRFVDDLICRELALETAFEGNRFHDLMRFAYRRNDPAFLADKVASKHSDSIAIKSKLTNPANWYLPFNVK